MIIHETPELYKAMALSYRKIPEGESWKIVHSRIATLVLSMERLNSVAQALGVDLSRSFQRVGVELLARIEAGDAGGALEVCEAAERSVLETLPLVATMSLYATASRVGASVVTLLSSAFLSLISFAADMEAILLIAVLAAGASISSLLLSRSRAALLTLLLSLLLQFVATTFLYSYDRASVAAVIISGAVVLLAWAVSRATATRAFILLGEKDLGAKSSS